MTFDRALADFVGVLREAGVRLSPVEAMDAQRAAMAVGIADREDLRHALRTVLVEDADQLETFERAFDAFFRCGAGARSGAEARLVARGATEAEIAALRLAIEAQMRAEGGSALAALVGGGGELDQLLAGAAREAGVATMRSRMQVGPMTQRLLGAAGLSDPRALLEGIRRDLRQRLGDAGDAIADLLEAEVASLRVLARAHVDNEYRRRHAHDASRLRATALADRPFAQLSAAEVERVTVEVRRLADRLRGRIAVRRKRRRRGHLDVRRTLRASWRTGGLPFRPVLRMRRPERPRLVLMCDISDSVRFAARFLLLLIYAVQEVFERTRTFVFVRDVGETTVLFERYPVDRAISLAYEGAVINVASNSDYGAAFGRFAREHLHAIDRRTTFVILGDGRTNHLDPNAAALARIARQARRVLWLNPEPRRSWGFGDSAMPAWLPRCDEALSVHNLDTLRAAVDRLMTLPP